MRLLRSLFLFAASFLLIGVMASATDWIRPLISFNGTNVSVDNATFAEFVNCEGIFGGTDPDFCNDAFYDDSGVVLNMTTFFFNISQNLGFIQNLNGSASQSDGDWVSNDDELYNDSSSVRVGIRTNSPTNALSVEGVVNATTLVGGDLLPKTNNTGNIGLEQLRWNHLYVQIANISELGGFSPIIVSTEIISSRNVTAPNYFGSGQFLTDINKSEFSNFSGNASFANVSNFADNATQAGSVNCEDIFGGTDPDFCNDSTDMSWEVNGSSLYNLTGNVGVGVAIPQARFHVVTHQRISVDHTADNYRSELVGEISDLTSYETVYNITVDDINDLETWNTVFVDVKGHNNESGNGRTYSEWSIEVTGGSFDLDERKRDKYGAAPKINLISSGNSVLVQVRSNNAGTDYFTGFVNVVFDAAQGGGLNGKESVWTIE